MSLWALVLAGAALGTILGMLGGGGGIIAVPLLVALGQPVVAASTMSLVVVGVGAAAALVPHQRAGRVDWRIGLTFGALGAVGAVVGARLSTVIPDNALLLGFSVLVVLGAVAMLRAGRRARDAARLSAAAGIELDDTGAAPTTDDGAATPVRVDLRVVLLASGVGLVTGLFGVGAGFVVVPALVAAMHLPIKRATATGLVVIVINSAVALTAKIGELQDIPSTLELAAVTALFAVVGALVSRRVPGWILSTAFGSLMILVAIYTVGRALTL